MTIRKPIQIGDALTERRQAEQVSSKTSADGSSEKLAGSPTNSVPSLRIVEVPIEKIRPDPRNARTHRRRQIKKMAKIIQKLGFCVPLLLDRWNKLIAGHARLEVCRLLGISKVPVIYLEHLDEAQARAFALADNRLSELAEWDDRILAEQLQELSLVLDFDVELTGFEVAEIDLRIESLKQPDKTSDSSDLLPDISRHTPLVTHPGDLWFLGEHQILCGDSREDLSYTTMLKDKVADSVLSDPPYNLKIRGVVSGLGKVKHSDFAMASGELSREEFVGFLTQMLSLFSKHSKDGSIHYLFIDWRHVAEMLAAGKIAYTELKNIGVWVKTAPGMGSFYRSQHELIAIFKSERGAHRNNVELGRYGRNRSNVFMNYQGPSAFGGAGEEGNLLALHPTIKPTALLADLLMDSTARGDIVLDGFLGSGSTVLAAERTGRRCYGIEIDSRYVDVAVRRWQTYTRQRARHAQTGRLFDEIEEKGREADE
jgi:DNA modification methylase